MHDESTSGEVVPGGAAKHASAAVDADAYATAALLAEELAEDYELTDSHLPRATSNVSAETTTARVAEIRASADAAYRASLEEVPVDDAELLAPMEEASGEVEGGCARAKQQAAAIAVAVDEVSAMNEVASVDEGGDIIEDDEQAEPNQQYTDDLTESRKLSEFLFTAEEIKEIERCKTNPNSSSKFEKVVQQYATVFERCNCKHKAKESNITFRQAVDDALSSEELGYEGMTNMGDSLSDETLLKM
jgi:hypothetical protein